MCSAAFRPRTPEAIRTLERSRQIRIASVPLYVRYDKDKYEATVAFRITQDENGDCLIDPSHCVFQFHGIDAYGNWMDPDGDEYDGDSLTGF